MSLPGAYRKYMTVVTMREEAAVKLYLVRGGYLSVSFSPLYYITLPPLVN